MANNCESNQQLVCIKEIFTSEKNIAKGDQAFGD